MTSPLSGTSSNENESDASWRATTSVRSRQRPSVKNSHVWSRLIVVSASPVIAAVWVFTKARYDAGPDPPGQLPLVRQLGPGAR